MPDKCQACYRWREYSSVIHPSGDSKIFATAGGLAKVAVDETYRGS